MRICIGGILLVLSFISCKGGAKTDSTKKSQPDTIINRQESKEMNTTEKMDIERFNRNKVGNEYGFTRVFVKVEPLPDVLTTL